jgi:hypothetical protein
MEVRMQVKHRLVLIPFALFLGLAGASRGADNQFVIVSDTQNIDGVDRMTREIIELDPPFVISVGDAPSAFDPRVRFFERLREAGIDVHIALGNHDGGVRPHLVSDLPPAPFNRKVDPILRFGVENRFYYSFNRGGIHFVIADTSTDDKEAHYEWLVEDLAKHANNPDRLPAIVFMHYPSWMLKSDSPDGNQIHRVLAEYPDAHTVRAGFAGHTHKGHAYPPEDSAGVPLYTLYPSAPFGADTHTEYVIATVHPDRITFERKVVLDAGRSGGFEIQAVHGEFGSLGREAGED